MGPAGRLGLLCMLFPAELGACTQSETEGDKVSHLC